MSKPQKLNVALVVILLIAALFVTLSRSTDSARGVPASTVPTTGERQSFPSTPGGTESADTTMGTTLPPSEADTGQPVFTAADGTEMDSPLPTTPMPDPTLSDASSSAPLVTAAAPTAPQATTTAETEASTEITPLDIAAERAIAFTRAYWTVGESEPVAVWQQQVSQYIHDDASVTLSRPEFNPGVSHVVGTVRADMCMDIGADGVRCEVTSFVSVYQDGVVVEDTKDTELSLFVTLRLYGNDWLVVDFA